LVGHFGLILTQIQRAAGLSPKQALSFTIDNLSVTELWLEAGYWRVAGINHNP
jgi:broad specificity phosphatase PhoE